MGSAEAKITEGLISFGKKYRLPKHPKIRLPDYGISKALSVIGAENFLRLSQISL